LTPELAGPTFQADGELKISLPSTRLGVTTRRQEFSLTSHSALSSDPVPAPVPKTNQTLRKAFWKTLATASGFRVRMRTVFVPYVLLPSSGGMVDEEDAPAAGMAESTVMLCVELENLGEASGGGFAVEAVDVDVSGDGARATLIRWDASKSPEQSLPIRLGAYEQHNLLYTVSFVRSADADDGRRPLERPGTRIVVHTTISGVSRPFRRPVRRRRTRSRKEPLFQRSRSVQSSSRRVLSVEHPSRPA
jgi:hypothetical protein